MTPIHVYITSGQNAGRRLVYSDPVVSFGRSGQNTLVLDTPGASREQGVLKFDGRQWWLENKSSNGTAVGRKTVRGKPVPLREGDVVSVGNMELFRISIPAAGEESPGAAPPGEQARPAAGESGAPQTARMTKKTKIIIGVGIYLLAMVVLFVVFGQLFTTEAENVSVEGVDLLNESQIENEINSLVEPAESLDPEKAAQLVREANRYYTNRTRPRINYYRAYRSYREALALRHQTRFEDAELDTRYRNVRAYLVKQVSDYYSTGRRAYDANNFRLAAKNFEEVIDLFPDEESRIYASAIKLRRISRVRGGMD